MSQKYPPTYLSADELKTAFLCQNLHIYHSDQWDVKYLTKVTFKKHDIDCRVTLKSTTKKLEVRNHHKKHNFYKLHTHTHTHRLLLPCSVMCSIHLLTFPEELSSQHTEV